MRRVAAALVGALVGILVIAFIPGAAQAAAGRPSNSISYNSVGLLDCNGFSTVQKSLFVDQTCAHPRSGTGGEVNDNGHYIGHDEPNMRFISNAPGSGNNVVFKLNLPKHNVAPAGTSSFQDYIAFWFGMALCDNNSYPQNTTCINNSDLNTGLGILATDAGSAVLEMQFYPPGYPNFFNNVSCDSIHWCASLHINSLECTFEFTFCNFGCIEPTNFAFITKDGVPIGPPSPQLATFGTFDGTNPDVFLMNPGDTLSVSIHDTPAGLLTGITDWTTHHSGFMVASAANGFAATNVNTCAGTFYSFHPEYDTAAVTNIVPWAALELGVSMDVETGHFEKLDHDADDTYCGTAPVAGPSCLSTDFDFDGSPYHMDGWPEHPWATREHPSPVNMQPLVAHSIGPTSGGAGYPIFELETDVGFTVNSVSACNILLPNQCGLPSKVLVPHYAGFYPFWSTRGCTAMFGNVAGWHINTYGGDAGYGPSQAVFSGTLAIWGTNGAFYPNSC